MIFRWKGVRAKAFPQASGNDEAECGMLFPFSMVTDAAEAYE
jgi:hypothetical protein